METFSFFFFFFFFFLFLKLKFVYKQTRIIIFCSKVSESALKLIYIIFSCKDERKFEGFVGEPQQRTEKPNFSKWGLFVIFFFSCQSMLIMLVGTWFGFLGQFDNLRVKVNGLFLIKHLVIPGWSCRVMGNEKVGIKVSE